jgi:putative transposase
VGADHKQLDVPVLFPRAQHPRQPWTTMFVDGFSRAVMGWAISDCPSSATVLAALGEGIRVDPDRGPFGGLPASIRPDRGLEFAADVLEQACGVLAVRLDPAPPYRPNLKGKIERLHGSLVTQLLAERPHFAGGPRDAGGRLWGSGGGFLTLAELVERFARWVRWHNTERRHAGLGGRTPLERWSEDATPLRLIPDTELRWTLLGAQYRRVRTSGVSFNGLQYVAPELNGLVGEVVEVRYRPHDQRSVEIFHGGGHLATARPQGTLSDEERAAVLARRRTDAAEQARRQRRAARRARVRFAPITESAPAEEVTVISSAAASAERGRGDDADLRRAARADLLGLPSRRRGR